MPETGICSEGVGRRRTEEPATGQPRWGTTAGTNCTKDATVLPISYHLRPMHRYWRFIETIGEKGGCISWIAKTFPLYPFRARIAA